MKKTVLASMIISVALVCGAFTGCNGKLSENPVTAVLDAAAEASAKNSRHPQSGHQVIILLGPDYAARPAILDPLVAEYGLAGATNADGSAAGGMLLPMKYPESFTVEKRVRLSLLTDAARTSGTTIIVTVGAPAGTVNELNKIRNSNPDMQIISLFPMEDAFPVEAVSTLVVDYTGSGDLLADEKSLAISDLDLSCLLLGAALSGEPLPPPKAGSKDVAAAPEVLSPQVAFTASLEAAKRMMKQRSLGADWQIEAFTDPETNLRSRNHLVVSRATGAVQ